MNVRLIEPDEYMEVEALWAACFPGDGGAFCRYYFERRTSVSNVLAAFDGGTMASALHMLPYPVAVCGRTKALGFIAGVGTLPEYRRRGIASLLLFEARKLLAARGCCASVLQPFDTRFYEKSGYMTWVRHDRYSFADDVAECEALSVPEPVSMARLYSDYVSGYNGYMVRDESYFSLLVEEYTRCGGVAAALEDSYALGYVFDGSLELDEFVAGDSAERLIRALRSRYGEVSFPMPLNSTVSFGALAERRDFNMIDVIDRETLLSGTGYGSVEALLASDSLAFDKY